MKGANASLSFKAIHNRICPGCMRMGGTCSPKQEHLRIIDEAIWEKGRETVQSRETRTPAG